jgi:hypothetical protein
MMASLMQLLVGLVLLVPSSGEYSLLICSPMQFDGEIDPNRIHPCFRQALAAAAVARH